MTQQPPIQQHPIQQHPSQQPQRRPDPTSTAAWRWVPEWHHQAGVVLAWPHANTDWASALAKAQHTYLELILAITQVEPVWLLMPDTETEKDFYLRWTEFLTQKVAPNPKHLQTIILPYNDTWLRDTGPLSLLRPQGSAEGSIKFLNFTFNGWGEKFEHSLDQTLAQRLAQTPQFSSALPKQAPFEQLDTIAEGGNLETNGTGIVLTQRPCLMHPNRPNGLDTRQWQQLFQDKLGATTLWCLDHGALLGDDTDSHIDTLVRFTNSNTLVYQCCDEPSYTHYDTLHAMKQQLESWTSSPAHLINGEPLRLVPLPWPAAVYSQTGERLAATYANFLILNHRILVPAYDVGEDQLALHQIQAQFPDHEAVLVNARALVAQGGSIHCATMQIHTHMT